MDTCGDCARDVEREVPKLARFRQADHDEGSPRPHEIGHSRQACLRVHMMECSHRRDQVEARGLERMLEKVAEDVLDSVAALNARGLDGRRVEIDSDDALRNGAQLTCERPVAASDIERTRAVARRRGEDQRVVVEIVVPAIRLNLTHVKLSMRYIRIRGASCD